VGWGWGDKERLRPHPASLPRTHAHRRPKLRGRLDLHGGWSWGLLSSSRVSPDFGGSQEPPFATPESFRGTLFLTLGILLVVSGLEKNGALLVLGKGPPAPPCPNPQDPT
jgi:hypothetical protein